MKQNPMSLIGQILPNDGITADELVQACKDRGMLATIDGDMLTVASKTKDGWLKRDKFWMPSYDDGPYEPGVVVLLDAWKDIV